MSGHRAGRVFGPAGAVVLLLPALYTANLIAKYGIEVPYWDQWSLVEMLQQARAGTLGLSDLWHQHNEHRILFPRLVMMSLAALTRWDIRYELYTSLLVAVTTLGILLRMLRTSRMPWGFMGVASVMSFSPMQGLNWIWGWQVQIFMSVLGVVGALWCADRVGLGTRWLVFAVLFAVLSTYSFSSGILLWPVVVPLLWRRSLHPLRTIMAWVFVATIVLVIYYRGYEQPSTHPSLLAFIDDPVSFGSYVLVYLGSPLSMGRLGAALGVGTILVALTALSVLTLSSKGRDKEGLWLVWAVLALYVLLCGAATGVGRMGFGLEQALSNRYVTISQLFVLSAFVLTWHAICVLRAAMPGRRWGWIFLLVFLVLSVPNYRHAEGFLRRHTLHLAQGMRCLVYAELSDDRCLEVLHPWANFVRENAVYLRDNGLTALGRYPVPWGDMARRRTRAYHFDKIDGVVLDTNEVPVALLPMKTGHIAVEGWAVDAIGGNALREVHVSLDGVPVALARYGMDRPDVARKLGNESFLGSGWRAEIPSSLMTVGRHELSIRMVSRDGLTYFEPEQGILVDIGSEGKRGL